MKEESYGLFNQKKKGFLTLEEYEKSGANLKFTSAITALNTDNINRDPKQFGESLGRLSAAMYSKSDEAKTDPVECVSVGGVCCVCRKAEGKENKKGGETKKVMDPLKEGAEKLAGDLLQLSAVPFEQQLVKLNEYALGAAVYMETASKAAYKASNTAGAIIKHAAELMGTQLHDGAQKIIKVWHSQANNPGSMPKTPEEALNSLQKLKKEDQKKLTASQKEKQKLSEGDKKNAGTKNTDDATLTPVPTGAHDDNKEEKTTKKKFSFFKKKDKDKE